MPRGRAWSRIFLAASQAIRGLSAITRGSAEESHLASPVESLAVAFGPEQVRLVALSVEEGSMRVMDRRRDPDRRLVARQAPEAVQQPCELILRNIDNADDIESI